MIMIKGTIEVIVKTNIKVTIAKQEWFEQNILQNCHISNRKKVYRI